MGGGGWGRAVEVVVAVRELLPWCPEGNCFPVISRGGIFLYLHMMGSSCRARSKKKDYLESQTCCGRKEAP